MKNIPLLLGTIIGTLILIIVVAVASSNNSGNTQDLTSVVDQSVLLSGARHTYIANISGNQIQVNEQETDSASNSSSQSGQDNALPIDNQPGNANEQSQENQELITIVEFSDFQCPACKAAQPAVDAVKQAYAGKLKLVFRHFPLDSIHPNARLAAIASEAVASFDPTKFWLMHDKLFAEQQKWSEIVDRGELKDTFAAYAVEIGLDRTKFLEKMEDDSIADLVMTDVTAGTQLGVNATPTFYVNGVKTSAPQLKTIVESLLHN